MRSFHWSKGEHRVDPENGTADYYKAVLLLVSRVALPVTVAPCTLFCVFLIFGSRHKSLFSMGIAANRVTDQFRP
jgi:hypothetical protein